MVENPQCFRCFSKLHILYECSFTIQSKSSFVQGAYMLYSTIYVTIYIRKFLCVFIYCSIPTAIAILLLSTHLISNNLCFYNDYQLHLLFLKLLSVGGVVANALLLLLYIIQVNLEVPKYIHKYLYMYLQQFEKFLFWCLIQLKV